MDWLTYKALCDRADVQPRFLLEETAALVSAPALRSKLLEVLKQRPIEKPPDHRGPAETDVFQLVLEPHVCAEIYRIVDVAAKQGLSTPRTRARGLGGFVESWAEVCEIMGAELEESIVSEQQLATSEGALTDAEQAVLDLIDGFNRIDLDAILRCFAEDAVYHNLPVDPVKGERAIRGVLEGFMSAASEVRWELLNMAVSPSGAVLTERVDRFKINNRWIALPVMGTFEVRDGLITHWRDYFDMAQFTSQVEATQHDDSSQ